MIAALCAALSFQPARLPAGLGLAASRWQPRSRLPVAYGFPSPSAEVIAALQAEEAAADAAAVEEAAGEWRALESMLPTHASTEPALTLYRDTNGWCPFCERVWLQLLVKGVPFREELIDLRDKPAWYLELVPTALVPAIK